MEPYFRQLPGVGPGRIGDDRGWAHGADCHRWSPLPGTAVVGRPVNVASVSAIY